MQAIRSNHPPGHVGIVSGDLSRYPTFMWSMFRLLLPIGSTWSGVSGNGFACQRNEVVQQMFDTNPDARWLWFIDDDHPFEGDVLLKLLDRSVDVLQPLISTRKPPYRPYAYFKQPDGGYRTPRWSEIPTQGLFQVDACGAGGCLIRRNVLEAVGKPWYEEGRTQLDALGEDLFFSDKARDKGFKIWIDCDNRLGHLTNCAVWPAQHDGQHVIELDMHHGVRVRVKPNIGFPKEEV